MNIMCWLWPLLAGLICGILGYLLGKSIVKEWKNKYKNLSDQLDDCKRETINLKTKLGASVQDKSENSSLKAMASSTADIDLEKKIASLEANVQALNDSKLRLEEDLDNCLSQRVKLESDLKSASLVSSAATVTAVAAFNADAAKAAYGKKIKQDDLKIVEGIGPKIEGLFHNHDIKTWKALSEASIEKCQEVLNSGGDRYRIHKPDTWPKQAKLAYEGKWEELVQWQDNLDGGKQ